MALLSAHKQLTTLWNARKDLKTIDAALKQLHELLLLPESAAEVDQKTIGFISRDYYEIFVLHSALSENFAGFEVAIANALNFYATTHVDSSQKSLLLGLQLLYLLSQQRLADFHMLLEQVPQEHQRSDPLLAYPIKLEQSLMEGSYSKVALDGSAAPPSPYYAPLMKIMQNSVRESVASCVEKAFKQISLAKAAELLFLKSPQAVTDFAAARGWKITDDSIAFEKPLSPMSQSLDTNRIAKQTLFYAKQLEMIV